MMIGNSGDKGRDSEEALQLAQTAKRKLPDDPYVMDALGWDNFKRELYDNAIAEFRSSLEILPENAAINCHLELAYYKKGETDMAREALKRALSLDSGFFGATKAARILK